jgi:SprT-like protein
VTNEELQLLTEKISEESFNKPFKQQALFNPRLRTTGGRYLLSSHNIEVNRKYYEQLGHDELVGIIKHELCHYHLHIEGKGYKHGDADFRRLLILVDAPRHCSPLPIKEIRKAVTQYVYECIECKFIYQRQRRVNTNRYLCGRCSGRLVKKG